MSPTYCYWSIATGPYAALMERCVASARRSGVFKEFCVLTDRPIEGCECYDAQSVDKTDGLFKLIYLKAGMWKLLFDYFVWVDADSWFVRNPRNILDCLGKSPIHVPLTTNLSALPEPKPLPRNLGVIDNAPAPDAHPPAPQATPVEAAAMPRRRESNPAPAGAGPGRRATTRDYVELMTSAGVYNPVYMPASSFWVLRRDAIDRVVELATHFRAFARERDYAADVSACLGYAMQMLCADPEAHRVAAWPGLWASDDRNQFRGAAPERGPWALEDALSGEVVQVNPCIVHLGRGLGCQLEDGRGALETAADLSPAPQEGHVYAGT